jgi:hypothetical protein
MATDTLASSSHHCEIVLVQGTHDANGFPCGRPAGETCSDCGSELCDLHTEVCEFCNQAFCSMCMWLHLEKADAKPAQPVSRPERLKRRA